MYVIYEGAPKFRSIIDNIGHHPVSEEHKSQEYSDDLGDHGKRLFLNGGNGL